MKKTNKINKTVKWFWIVVAFILGFGIGYTTYYLLTNWNSFFEVCENGDRPDKKGCCESTVVCQNGNKPDKNGCCEGEVYTDAGDGWMVCCPNGGDNCFPPINNCVPPIKK